MPTRNGFNPRDLLNQTIGGYQLVEVLGRPAPRERGPVRSQRLRQSGGISGRCGRRGAFPYAGYGDTYRGTYPPGSAGRY